MTTRRLPADVPVIEVTRASKSFRDVVALSDISCTIGPGMTAILGPNGAGKSTLLRLVCGLTRPSEGTVRLLGADPRGDPELFRRLALVPQQEAVFDAASGQEFVAACAAMNDIAEPDVAAGDALRMVDLDPADPRPLRTYSKGMRQRVKVAQALAHDPDVLVLDEPLNGMDPRQRVRTIDLFRQLADDGRCVVVSSHVLAEVERFGSRILLLAQGRLVAEGDFHDIRGLMDDRPRRVRVRTDRPRELAAALLAAGAADGTELDPQGGIVLIDTRDVATFRGLVASVAQQQQARLFEVAPLDEDLESVFRYLVGGRP